jgi:hypothetical protein
MNHAADAEVLQRVLRESGVDQTVAAPSWGGYGVAVLERFFRWVNGHWPHLGFLERLSGLVGPGLILAVIGLVVLVLVLVARSMLDARRRRAAAPSPVLTIPTRTPVLEKSREGWRQEIERRLAAGDLAGALEALWWWFARALTSARVDPAWTSRELLAHARRPDLGGLALGLDRLLYGPSRPRAEDIDGFLRHAEEALP